MSGHQSSIPPAVYDYFFHGTMPADVLDRAAHPTVEQTYRPEVGWKRYTHRKRISQSHARWLRSQGVTVVALRCCGRVADFRIKELVQ